MVNIEIKARCADPDRIRAVLRAEGARFVGEDHQVDTYFRVRHGRLKVREGRIEQALIHYDRPDQAAPKRSDVMLYAAGAALPRLKEMLTRALGILVVVEKRREIYFIGNVKFHLDRVEGLGAFVEIEALDREGAIPAERLQRQCERYLSLFGLPPDALVPVSYSDLLRGNLQG